MVDDHHLEKSKIYRVGQKSDTSRTRGITFLAHPVVLINIVNSLLKSCNNTANINVKKLQFIHSVNGDGSKTAKIIKGNVNHTNIDIQAMLVTRMSAPGQS